MKAPEEVLTWPALRGAVLYRDDFECQLCGADANEVDHIFPRSLGGPDHMDNLQAICGPCNKAKGAKWLAGHLELEDLERFRQYATDEYDRITAQLHVLREVTALADAHDLPLPDAWVALGWRTEGGRLRRRLRLPCVEVRALLPRRIHYIRGAA